MKNFIFTFVVMQFFIGCWPYDNFGANIRLENIESTIRPEKDVYDLSDTISLEYFFKLDSEKFYEYEYSILVYCNKETNANDYPNEAVDNHILVYNESGENVTNKHISYMLTETKETTLNFNLIPKIKGSYCIFIGGRAFTRKEEKGVDSYYSGHVHYLTIQ